MLQFIDCSISVMLSGNISITANGTGAVTAVLDNDFDAGNAGVGWNVSPVINLITLRPFNRWWDIYGW